ncbi:MAG: Uma2 family endonuclease [Microcoleus sp. PH2017_25_DOB_D_A]|uniref:Uma2 family endonuclease n=1 Tax=unclassified Microcoleus TaxID=2642155 RepID=UPI001D4A1749|nr:MULTISPECIES: Uma2 family endonuclease [unclassified Microcoleus]MCC3532957.1 Uma2 family endonuclease [Microcoleus sp. PH2017_25_DOB_D_A]MCC3544942.1 Uma2 family endonuclease [Microcoleus sp. PH2017_24_DOB_U_A]TAE45430.1 MAG: Uma2 family endonuclease [Oscillatoriales cyanobacterium]
MTLILDKPKDQRLTHSGIDWQQFKLIEQGFSDSPGIRLFYFKGEVEILAVSQEHESFSRTIAGLLMDYFVEKDIEFNPLGSFTQEKGQEVSVQADESFLIGKSTGKTPDLAIEVVFTSGGESKLNRYQALGVPEVWFWEDGLFGLYHLRSHGYEKIAQSEVLPDLDINLLSRCLLMASRIEAVKEFRRGISGL